MRLPNNHARIAAATMFVASLHLASMAKLYAQGAPVSAASIGSLVRSTGAGSAATGPGVRSPSEIVSIKNRARLLGDQPSPSGTRYFAVTDSAIRDLRPDQLRERLSPTVIKAGDGVRRLDIVVEVRRPLTVRSSPGASEVYIGTALVEAGPALNDIEVRASIFTSGITVITK